MAGAWGGASAWGGGGTSDADRERLRASLPKGEESCHICGEESKVEVKLRPCDHEMCLECCNRMRQSIVFKADAGLKCPFCREYVDGFTDMLGRYNTIPDLIEANRAARKSHVARKTGAADKAVSTSVPDPQRLVPPIGRSASTSAAAAAEVQWTCTHCRHVNVGNKAECSRCHSPNPDHVRPGDKKDVLAASDEDLVRLVCERHHPGIGRAFADAGTPWTNGAIAGDKEAMRVALRARKHERLMRLAHVLAASDACLRCATDIHGNYVLQSVLEASHKLRVEALAVQQMGGMPAESFAWLPGSSAGEPVAMHAFSRLLKTLTAQLIHRVATNEYGVHVLLKLLKLASPPELAYIGEQSLPHLIPWLEHKEGSLFACLLTERLSAVAVGGSPQALKASAVLSSMCGQLLQHSRTLVQAARHQYQGQMLVNMLQGALPGLDAFKMGYQLALNAPHSLAHPNGARTLELLADLKVPSLRCREMVRDIFCYAAKALQGRFGELACKNEQGGERVVRAVAGLMLAEREDDWLLSITRELVAAGAAMRGNRDAQATLVHCLALPLWRAGEMQAFWQALEGTGLDVAALKHQVERAKVSSRPLPERVHRALSEVQPASPAEALRRFPYYVRDGASEQPRHSMLKRPGQEPAAAAAAQQQQQQQQAAAPQARPPPPGFATGAAPATGAAAAAPPSAAAAGPKAAPPGFSPAAPAAPSAAAAPAAAAAPVNGVTFPNGVVVPMPQPYSAADAAGPSSQAAAAATAAPPPKPAAPAVQPPPPPKPAAPAVQPPPPPVQAAPAVQPLPPPKPAAPPVQPPPPVQLPPPPAAAPQAAPPQMPPQPPALNVAAPAFAMRPLQPPPPTLSSGAAAFVPAQAALPAAPPVHLQALPPHLQQRQQQQLVAAASSSSAGAMAAPATPVPPQHSSAAAFTPQQAPQPRPQQPPPQPPAPAALLPHLFGAAAPRPQAQQAQPQAGGSAAAEFGGFSTLTEMLSELTATAAPPPPPAPRPAAAAYRPAYRPPAAYRPPTATAPAAPAAPAAQAIVPPPIAGFPVPGQARAAAAAPRPPPPPPEPAWDCQVCSYHHAGAEFQYLCCAMCGTPQS